MSKTQILWSLVLAYLVVANLISFAMFGLDKYRARNDRRRISESALILSAALSGTIGGWLGMRVYRHKTSKRSFQVKMVAATVVDVLVVGLIVWIST